jgi:hypothetical protein
MESAHNHSDTLLHILNRLERIEGSQGSGHSTNHLRSPTSDASATSLIQPHSTNADGITPESNVTKLSSRTCPLTFGDDPDESLLDLHELLSPTSYPYDVTSLLNKTFDDVRTQRLRHTVGHEAMTTEGIYISPDSARSYIRSKQRCNTIYVNDSECI